VLYHTLSFLIKDCHSLSYIIIPDIPAEKYGNLLAAKLNSILIKSHFVMEIRSER